MVQRSLQLRRTRSEGWAALPYLGPGILLVAVFVLYPQIFNIAISFSDYSIMSGDMVPTGFANYQAVLGETQGRFWFALRNNLLYGVVVTSASLFLGLLFAVWLGSIPKGKIFFRTVLYLPVLTSWVIVGLVFRYLFNSNQYGLVNYLLVDVFHVLNQYIPWLTQEWTGNFTIWVLGIWKTSGWVMVIYIAALQSVPRELYEAAQIDGAGASAQFRRITLPLLMPTHYFLVVNLLIGAFNVFLQVWLLTGGDPRGRTNVLNYLLYDRTFNLLQFGEGAAIGFLSAVLILALTLVGNRLLRFSRGEE